MSSRLVDPTICPDCRARLDSGGACPACGLRLQGPLATRLWETMVTADRLIDELRRAQPTGAAAPASAGPTAAGAGGPVPGPPPFPATPPRPHRRLPAFSVPAVLLGLGALCLLVAAVVFVAVAWDLLGLTGRTLVLLAITGGLAGVGVLLGRRGLRGAAEAFTLIVAGMLAVDVLGAQEAGLLGLDALSWRGTAALLGGVLVLTGVVAGWWAKSQPIGRLYSAEAVAVLGAFIVTGTNGWAAENPAVGTSIATAALLAGAAALLPRLPAAGAGITALGAVSWLVLLGIGCGRAAESTTPDQWWADARGWPLLVAAGLPALTLIGARLAGRYAALLRQLCTGLVLLPLVVLGNAPLRPDATEALVLVAATLLVLAGTVRFAPLLWSRAAGVLAATGVVALGGLLVGVAVQVLDGLPGPDVAADLSVTSSGVDLAAWLPGVLAVAVAGAVAALARFVSPPPATGWRVAAVLASAAAGLAAADVVLLLRPPLWAAVLALGAAAGLGAAVAWLVREDLVPAVLGSLATAVLSGFSLIAAAPSHLLSAVVGTVLSAGLFAAAAVGGGRPLIRPACGFLGVLAGAYALSAWALTMSADLEARALALAVYAVLAGALARPVTGEGHSRIALEAAASVVALVSLPLAPDPGALAMVLTVVGSGVVLVSVLNRDRSPLGWAGAALLFVATLVRADQDVPAPELYALPAAAVLIGAGWWRLAHDPRVGSVAALGSGVTLALLPSLLLALDEPVSVRGALVAAGGLAALGAGVWQRLAAPFVMGALSTGLLALRHLEPVADAVPRWLSLGLVGVVLLAVGITWEARLRNVRTARRYLAGLR